MRWNAIFNTHFSVLVNFVLFVYLDVYLQLNFVSMNICNICHFFQLFCHIIVIVLRHILKAIRKFNRLSRQFFIFYFFYLFISFFIHSESSIGVLEKMLLEFLEHLSISISKHSFNEKLGKLPIKTSILEPFIRGHLEAFQICERLLAVKGSCPFQTCK